MESDCLLASVVHTYAGSSSDNRAPQFMTFRSQLVHILNQWPTVIIGLGLLLTLAWVGALGWGSYLLLASL